MTEAEVVPPVNLSLNETQAPANGAGKKGLSEFQELVAGVICGLVFMVMLVQILYRSKKRQIKIRQVTKRQRLDTHTRSKSKLAVQRNTIANESLKLYRDNCKPFVPYTGRPVPGLVDMRPGEQKTHPSSSDWLDFREYARFVAVKMREEVFQLAREGLVSMPPRDPHTYTFRDMMQFMLAEGILPSSMQPEAGAASMGSREGAWWLCHTYDKWRYGMRPGEDIIQQQEAVRFKALAEGIIRHLMESGLRCLQCHNRVKNVKFDPCMHVCTCTECASKASLSECPVCKVKIRHTLPAGEG